MRKLGTHDLRSAQMPTRGMNRPPRVRSAQRQPSILPLPTPSFSYGPNTDTVSS